MYFYSVFILKELMRKVLRKTQITRLYISIESLNYWNLFVKKKQIKTIKLLLKKLINYVNIYHAVSEILY